MNINQTNTKSGSHIKNTTLNVNFCQHLGNILMYLYIVIHQKDSATLNQVFFPPQVR